MGIYPNVNIYPLETVYKFSSVDEALDYFKTGFHVTNGRQDGILREYLDDKFRRENGYLVMEGSSDYAMIWWRKQFS